MEEELPPGFWEAAQEPHRPPSNPEQQVRAELDRSPRDEISASAPAADSLAGHLTLSDPAFETLRELFPGRIIAIDIEDEAPDEEAPPTVPEVGNDEDETGLLQNENHGMGEVD